MYLSGGKDDLEEIADMIARRIAGGVVPGHIFDDVREASQNTMKRIFEQSK